MNSCEAARRKGSSWQYQLNCICRWGFKILCSRQYLQQASKRLLHYIACLFPQPLSTTGFSKKFNVKCMHVFRYSGNWFKYNMISKGQCKVKEEAILALFSFKPRKKLSVRHAQIKNLPMPQKTGSFYNIHFNSRCFLLHLVFRLSSSKKGHVKKDW